jgi:hypothetical protein
LALETFPMVLVPRNRAISAPQSTTRIQQTRILVDGHANVQQRIRVSVQNFRLKALISGVLQVLLYFALVALGSTPLLAQTPLVRLTTPGPWPGVSQMIAYDGKIWFANSNPFENFNAADIYTFDPATRETRYERGLFSQHIGRPAIYHGALYWPFEDPRSNLALGEYAVTDGDNWALNIFTTGITLHVHAMEICNAALIAGTGGWVGGLQMSPTGGDDWREIYQMPATGENLSRITDVRAIGDRCYFAVTSWNEPGSKLMEWQGNGVADVAGWPDGSRVLSPIEHEGDLYGINQNGTETEIWRFDGTASSRVPAPEGVPLRALASNGDNLFLLTGDLTSATLWRSNSENGWDTVQNFAGERPLSLYALGNDIYVGTYVRGGQGSLWGPEQPQYTSPGPQAQALQPAPVAELSDEIVQASAGALESAITPNPDYMAYRYDIISVMLPLALTRNPTYGNFLSEFMLEEFTNETITTFTGTKYKFRQIIRWFSLHMMAINGNGAVPTEWLSGGWRNENVPSEKYFYIYLAAIRAVGWIGQNDSETISALISRLTRTNEPEWLNADAIASLTALTGQRFAYDIDKWQAWWAAAERGETSWPDGPQPSN